MTKPIGIRFDEELIKELKAEAESTGKSMSQLVNERVKKSFKFEAGKYKGLKLLRMSKDFTCYNCQKKHKAGRQAFYDAETGATLCLECAIEEGITPETNVKKDIKLLERKKLLKDYNLVTDKVRKDHEEACRKQREIYFAQDRDRLYAVLEDLKDLVVRWSQTNIPSEAKEMKERIWALLKKAEETELQTRTLIEKHVKLPPLKKKKKKKKPYVT